MANTLYKWQRKVCKISQNTLLHGANRILQHKSFEQKSNCMKTRVRAAAVYSNQEAESSGMSSGTNVNGFPQIAEVNGRRAFFGLF